MNAQAIFLKGISVLMGLILAFKIFAPSQANAVHFIAQIPEIVLVAGIFWCWLTENALRRRKGGSTQYKDIEKPVR